MAIQTAGFRNYNIKRQASEELAKQMADEQEKESGFSSFLSMAAPLAASFLLPGVGTALMGGLGTTGVGGFIGSSLAGTGGSSLLGGLLAGGGKALGTYAIGEGMEGLGRSGVLGKQFGADVDEIDMSEFGRIGKEAEEEGKESLQSSIDAMESGQRKSSLMSGLTTGVDKMGGFDKIKEMSSDYAKKYFKGNELINPSDKTVGINQAAWKPDLAADVIKKERLQQVEPIADTPLIDTPLTEMPVPSFTSSLATEGAPLLDLSTDLVKGDSSNFLEQLMGTVKTKGLDVLDSGSNILDSLTEFTQDQLDIIASKPNMTQEELDELLASWRG